MRKYFQIFFILGYLLLIHIPASLSQGITNGNDYDTNKNGSGAERKQCCTHKKNRLVVDQEYEMKPMLGVRSSRLLEKEPSYSSKERLGNGELKKYRSISLDNSTTEVMGRFINVTQLSNIHAFADEVETLKRPSGERIAGDDACDDACEADFTEEAPHHKLSVAKSTCSDCKTERHQCKCTILEARIEEMSFSMQRLESQMEVVIALLGRNEIASVSQNQERDSNESRERSNCSVTSVWHGAIPAKSLMPCFYRSDTCLTANIPFLKRLRLTNASELEAIELLHSVGDLYGRKGVVQDLSTFELNLRFPPYSGRV